MGYSGLSLHTKESCVLLEEGFDNQSCLPSRDHMALQRWKMLLWVFFSQMGFKREKNNQKWNTKELGIKLGMRIGSAWAQCFMALEGKDGAICSANLSWRWNVPWVTLAVSQDMHRPQVRPWWRFKQGKAYRKVVWSCMRAQPALLSFSILKPHLSIQAGIWLYSMEDHCFYRFKL